METDAPPTPPPPPPPPPPPHAPHPGLRRDRENGILGGVCAGIANTYGVDVMLVRVLWVVAAVLWIGVPAYVIAWIAIPQAQGSVEHAGGRRDPGVLIGLVLVAIGVIIASNRLLPNGLHFDRFGAPLLLIGGGLAILVLRAHRDDDRDDDQRQPGRAPFGPPAPPTSAPPGPASSAAVAATSTPTATLPSSALADSAPAADPDPATAPTEPVMVPPSAWTQTAPWPAQPSARSLRRAARGERRARRPRSFITPITLSVLLIGAGIASLLQATGALDVNLTVLLAMGTGLVGAALVVAAFAGRAHALILVGVLLLGATAIANTIDVPLRGGIGQRVYRPQTVAELESHYELGIGKLVVDLRDVPLAGRDTSVAAQLGAGELLVQVPSDVRVEVKAHAGAGSLMLFGREQGGWPENETRAVAGTGSGTLHLDLRVGAGQVRVQRFEPDGFETILGGNP